MTTGIGEIEQGSPGSRDEPLARPTHPCEESCLMMPVSTSALRAVRSLGVLLMVIALAGCAGAATTAPRPTLVANQTASAGTSAPSHEPTATPLLAIRTDYDLPEYAELVKLFDYDPKEPLGYKVTHQERQEGATLEDITYRSTGYEMAGKLVIPDGKGPFPVMLFAPGHGGHGSDWLLDMVAFAKDGYAGLAIQERSTIDLYGSLDGKGTVEGYKDYVVDLRRAIDLLGTLPQIDAKRLGFAGHSLGCSAGSILSGLETRIAAYALLACGGYITVPSWSCFADPCQTATSEERARYEERIAVLNPVNYISHNAGAAFLVQASKTDPIAEEPNVEALFAAAPEPKRLAWYEGGHMLGCTGSPCDAGIPVATDHRAWLRTHV
jgi:dienelactone hydrolase